MFRFLTSPSTPLPLRTLHLLQTALAIPSLPILVICIFGLLVLGPSPVLLVQFPWILSSGSNFVLLIKERRAAAQGELDARRYARLQAFKVTWTGVFFAPVVVAWVFAERMRLFVWVVVNIKCWVEWEWAMMAWFNALHWWVIFLDGQTCRGGGMAWRRC